MKRIGLYIALGAALAALAAGCGKRDSAAPKGKAITFMYYGSPQQSARVERNVAQFRQLHPDIAVKTISMQLSDAYSTKLLTMFAGGNPPDVMYMLDRGYREYLERGLLLDLSGQLTPEQIGAERWFPQVKSLCSQRGGVYALPVYVSPMVLHYNTALFKECGVPFPTERWTWKDFLDAAQKITAKTGGREGRFGFCTNLKNIDHMSPFLFQSGGKFGPDGFYFLGAPGKQERNIEAFQFYLDLPYKYHVAPQPDEAKDQNGLDLFLANRIGMYISWFEATEYLLSQGGAASWDIAECPVGRVRGTTLHTTVAAVSGKTKSPREAALLARFLMGSPERAMPPFKDEQVQRAFLEKAGLAEKNWRVYVKSTGYAQYVPILESRYQPVFASQLDQMWIGKMSAKDAWKLATASIETINKGGM